MAVRLATAAVLALALGLVTFGQGLGGIPEAWSGDYVRLVYAIIHNPPPGFALRYELVFSVEVGVRDDGTRWTRVALEGDFAQTPPDMHLGDLPLSILWSPAMALQVSTLQMIEPPLLPGRRHELVPPPLPPDLGFLVPFPRGWLEISEEEVEVAGVRAVAATLVTVMEVMGTEITTKVWLALPKAPVLPYPVWVRPPDDPAAAWMSEVKLLSYSLVPPERKP